MAITDLVPEANTLPSLPWAVCRPALPTLPAHQSEGMGTQTAAAHPQTPHVAGHPWTSGTGSASWCAQWLQDGLRSAPQWDSLCRWPQLATYCHQSNLTPMAIHVPWHLLSGHCGPPSLRLLPLLLSASRAVGHLLSVCCLLLPNIPCLPPCEIHRVLPQSPEKSCLLRKEHPKKQNKTGRMTVSLELDLTLWKQLKNA